ncbi:uncharacterized protein LOC143239535 isoform X4 [Tachypleus tridentatus]|uniref:uncharacterized protein LOC143239535 isoform X4 n=1 Tax=Tachypleus tridentatus TaxID=6853 RepID=UPI003FD3F32B
MDASDGRAAEFTTLQTARAYREHRQTHTGQGRGEPRVVGGPFVSLGRMSAGNQDLRKYGNNVTDQNEGLVRRKQLLFFFRNEERRI